MAFTSQRTKIELLSPIDGSILVDITTKGRSASVSRRPTYASRGYHRSAAVTAARLRTQGTITLQLNADDLALLHELERWQKGVVWYPMAADLRGRRYRQPDLRITFLDAQGAVEEVVRAYGVKLSDESLDLGMGPAKESISLDVLGGFELKEGGYEPVRALDFHRTGPATYIAPDGTLKTAGDGVARFGLPGPVVRRNKLAWSTDLTRHPWETVGVTVIHNAAKAPDGTVTAQKLVLNSGAPADYTSALTQPITASGNNVWSVRAKAGGRSEFTIQDGDGNFGYWNLATGLTLSGGTHTPTATMVPEGDGWFLCQMRFPPGSAGTYWYQYFAGGPGNGVDGIFFWIPQAEPGSSATAPQPTNATGVDYSHPLNGAGLVLEGHGRNYLVNSGLEGSAVATNWGNAGAGSGSISNGAQSFIASMQWGGFFQDVIFGSDMPDLWLRVEVKGDGAVCDSYFYDAAGNYLGSGTGSADENLGDGWRLLTVHAAYPNARRVAFRISDSRASAWTPISFRRPSLEANAPFRTSFIKTPVNSGGERQPDRVGIVYPQNELIHSHDLTQSAWNKLGTCSITKIWADNVVAFPTVNDLFYQLAAPRECAGSTFTLAVKLRLGTLSGQFSIGFADQSGALIKQTTFNTSQLSASDTRTLHSTASIPPGVTAIWCFVQTNSGTGTIIVESIRCVRGHHPGIEVMTTDTPILPPPSPALDPAWSQNGTIEWEGVYPTTGHYYLIGYNDLAFRVYRDAIDGMVWIDRGHNGASGSYGVPGRGAIGSATNITDGSRHRFRYTWTSEINDQSGVREMWQRLYIDGVLVAQQDVAALYGATAWAEIDPSRLISDGNCFAVLSRITLDYPTPRAGYRQA